MPKSAPVPARPPATSAAPSPAASPSPTLVPVPRKASAAAVSSGTGFVVSAGDIVITNEHVVSDCTRVVAIAGENEYESKLLATDESADLAALRLAGARLSPLPISVTADDLGAEIVVLGFPLTSVLGTDLRVTTGVISALSGILGERKLMQVSAAVQPGNSGGPVLDAWGGVSGVVVAKLGRRYSAENVNFAVRAPALRSFLELNGISYLGHKRSSLMRPSEIARKSAGSVVLLKCY